MHIIIYHSHTHSCTVLYTCRLYKELQDVAESQYHRQAEGGVGGGGGRDEGSGGGDGRTSSATIAALQHQLATIAKVRCYRRALTYIVCSCGIFCIVSTVCM